MDAYLPVLQGSLNGDTLDSEELSDQVDARMMLWDLKTHIITFISEGLFQCGFPASFCDWEPIRCSSHSLGPFPEL
jgi:hypothetical protein